LLLAYSKDEYDPQILQAQFDVLESALCGGPRRGNGRPDGQDVVAPARSSSR
jgi:hypothetical protein